MRRPLRAAWPLAPSALDFRGKPCRSRTARSATKRFFTLTRSLSSLTECHLWVRAGAVGLEESRTIDAIESALDSALAWDAPPGDPYARHQVAQSEGFVM